MNRSGSILKSVTSVLLLAVLLCCSLGLRLNFHFCKNELAEWSFLELEVCNPELDEEEAEAPGDTYDRTPCCDLASELIHVDFFDQADDADLQVSDPPMLLTTTPFTGLWSPISEYDASVCRPPPLSYARPALYLVHQTFLI